MTTIAVRIRLISLSGDEWLEKLMLLQKLYDFIRQSGSITWMGAAVQLERSLVVIIDGLEGNITSLPNKYLLL